MAAQETYSRSQTNDTQSQQEAGLAEWTSKIKAMQRQVDADEEAEHVRLEQEIAASRQARIRRSQGLGYTNRSTSSLVSSLKDEAETSGLSENQTTHGDTLETSAVRQSNRVDALHKLSGTPSTAIHARASQELKKPSTQALPNNEMKLEPVSLAAFIGGRATGPRLNKPAPQLDAHDPTQFEQHSTNQGSHPLFGSGGVAMPGIAVRRDGPAKPSSIAAFNKTSSVPQNTDSSPGPRNYAETYQKTSPIPRSSEVRERTKSTPSYAAPSSAWVKQETSEPSHKVIASPTPTSRTHSQERISRTQSTSPAGHGMDAVKTSPKSPIVVPSLAGPIRPQPRPSSSGPQSPASGVPSKAFLRTPVQKEPTPSLSRLQGRGFVQNIVNLSSQLESAPPSAPVTPEKNKPAKGGRHSVLDRWQPNVSPSSPSPPASPSSRPVRRSITVDPSMEKSQAPLAEASSRPSKETPSNRLSAQETEPTHLSPSSKLNGSEKPAGLGSNTTLVVYKPKPVEVPPLDEFGVKSGRIPDLPVASKPLSHPTKERARKPRKHQIIPSNARSIGPDSVFPDHPPSPSSLVKASSDIPRGSSPISNPPVTGSEIPPGSSQEPASNEPIPTPSAIDLRQASKVPDRVEQVIPDLGTTNDVDPAPPSVHLWGKKVEPVPIRQALPGLAPQIGSKRPLPSSPAPKLDDVQKVDHGVSRRALPGMNIHAHKPGAIGEPKPIPQFHDFPAASDQDASALPSSPPVQRSRIPSTGNRPTVMGMAQTLIEHEGLGEPIMAAPDPPQSLAVGQVSRGPPNCQIEKRKSSYEKYSSFTLPTLKEEATPTPTPVGTLSRKGGGVQSRVLQERTETMLESPPGKSLHGTITIQPSQIAMQEIDINSLLNYNTRSFRLDPGITTVSVEVLSIIENTATTLSKDTTIFYDAEILAVIHRYKSQKSGLASTELWGWEGQRAKLGEREQRKLGELAKRYGTTVNLVLQYSESPYLVHILGGVLATRQGTREHWSPENTSMHLVRSVNGMIIIDEKDLDIKNLCSAYSYCVSILETVYVWYGRGSTPLERAAALEYGQSLSTGLKPVEITDGVASDDDEMFWMILGEENYADAYYWRWRRTSPVTDPRIWRVRANFGRDNVTTVNSFSGESYAHDSVYLVDSIWELYVLVAIDARAQRQDITLALDIALEISNRVSPARPYTPTVHALVLPSQLPMDLKLMFRDLDELSLNKGEIPDHMNILSSTDAREHLDTLIWDDVILRDQTMLPLGVGVESTAV